MRSAVDNKIGFSLVEVVISIALFALLSTAVVSMMFAGFSSTKQGTDYVVAAGLVQEGVEAVRSIRNRDFASLVNGTHGLDTGSGYFELDGFSDSLIGGSYTRTVTIETVYRDGGGDIAVSGTEDAASRRVIVNVTWDTLEGKTQNIDAVFYVYDFTVTSSAWVDTSLADFGAGFFNSTMVQSGSGDGEVTMEQEDADWGSLIQQYSVDTDGTGNPVFSHFDAVQNVLYVLTANTAGDEFSVFDASDVSQSAPVKIDGYDVGGVNPFDFDVANGYVYIATSDNAAEVHVVRLSDMSLVNTIDTTGNADAYAVAVTGTRLLVGMDSSDAGQEMYAFDISDPEGVINQVGSTELEYDCRALVTDGSYAYCGSDEDDDELTAIRLSDYSVVDTIDLPDNGNVTRLRIFGDSLYVGRQDQDEEPDFLRVDISNPESSFEVAQALDTASTVNGIFIDIDEEYAFLGTTANTQELTIVDLSTFTEVQWYDIPTSSNARTVAQFGRYIYVLTDDDSSELNVIRTQMGNWEGAEVISGVDIASANTAHAVAVDGNFAYVGTNSNGGHEFYVYDIATPSSPVFLGSAEVSGTVNDIEISGNYAYLATSRNNAELTIIDITTKTSPSVVGTYNPHGNRPALAVAYSETTVYLARQQHNGAGQIEFAVVDVSNPAAPTAVGTMDYSHTINALVVDGSDVYAGTDNASGEMIRIDVSNPASPIVATVFNVPNSLHGNAIALSGNIIALGRDAGTGDELVLIDVSNPASPSLIGGANVATAINAVEFDGAGYLFLGVDANDVEFQRWDVSTPSAPVVDLTVDTNNDVEAIAFDGTNVHVATESNIGEYQIVGSAAITEEIPRRGIYTSAPFDSESATTTWNEIDWTADLGGGGGLFKMEVGATTATHNFSTVNLQNAYVNPVVVALYRESANTIPVSIRLRNIDTDSFDVRLHNPSDMTPLLSDPVHYMVVEEGAWTMPDGTLIEARTLDTSVIGYKNNWGGGVVQSFTAGFASAPAVFHQVQTYSDTSWIETWISSSAGNTNPPDENGFKIALNGAEASTSHGSETIGWIAIETGTGIIDGLDFEVSITPDAVTGHDNACSVYSFSNTYATAPIVMVDQQEMDGADGGWGSSCSLSSSQVGMYVDEDQVQDSERSHTNETFAWAAFETAFAHAEISPATIGFRLRTASSEAGLATAMWVGPDGTADTLYTNPGTAITTHAGATGTRWCQYQAYFVSDSTANPALQEVTIEYAP